MARGQVRDERKEQQRRDRINQWRASRVGLQAFCAQHSLATASFYHWRRVLTRRAADRPVFVPKIALAEAVPVPAGALAVVLGDARSLRVSPGFDAATLRHRFVSLSVK